MTDVVGAQLPEEQVEWQPALSAMGPEKTIAIFNPLSSDFRVLYSRSLAAQATPSAELAFAREKSGLDLSKRSQVQEHRTQSIILKAGQTINLPGDIAQKAVQDLVTYILGVRTGHKRTADPYSRGETEKEIIISIKNTTDFLNMPQVEDVPEAVVVAPPASEPAVPKPSRGRPPKQTKPLAPPPPGTGFNYDPAEA